VPTEVIGVMPASFQFPVPEIQLWTPLVLKPQATAPFTMTAVGRLKQESFAFRGSFGYDRRSLECGNGEPENNFQKESTPTRRRTEDDC
jgi:hypothetical protein